MTRSESEDPWHHRHNEILMKLHLHIPVRFARAKCARDIEVHIHRGHVVPALVACGQYVILKNVTHAHHMDASTLYSDEGRGQLRKASVSR